MNIGIIGGGNMGCVLAGKFAKNNRVTLYTNLKDKIDLYDHHMRVYCEDNNSYYSANIFKITDSLQEFCELSDYIFVTFPSFLFEQLCKDILPFLKETHHLFFVPGSGGAELFFKPVLEKGVTISGLQRVHSVARIIEFGKLTKESGIRKQLHLASIPNSYNKEACKIVSQLYNLPVTPLQNYLNVTFVNSNPILHTSRLYSIFKDYPNKIKEYDKLPLFYEEWSDETSQLLIEMDKELFSMFDVFKIHGLVIEQITSLLEHYESTNYQELTNKIRSINSLKGLTTPFVLDSNGKYLPDLSSRYFTADFPLGLDILLAFGNFLHLDFKNMKKVSDWYHRVAINNNSTFSVAKFGFNSLDELIQFYK